VTLAVGQSQSTDQHAPFQSPLHDGRRNGIQPQYGARAASISSVSDGRTLRVGVVGLGVAAGLVLPEITAHPGVRITAGADPRPEAREAFASQFQAQTYTEVEALCASPNVDLVYIFTPNRLHAQHAVVAAEHGKQVILDKPIGLSLAEADQAIAAAERSGVRLLVGHTQSLDAPIRAMANLVGRGELGRLLMVNTWFFSDWLYRPRSLNELDPAQGEGLVLRQGPVQVDIVRMIGGGQAHSVRATATAIDRQRPINGSYSAFASFDNGAAATLVYSGHAYFDTTELTYGVGLQGYPVGPDTHARSRAQIAGFADHNAEHAYKDSTRYGNARRGSSSDPGTRRHAFFGLTIASCEGGDIRQTPTGLVIYGPDGARQVDVDAGPSFGQRYTTAELDLMLDAWTHDRPLASHDGVWARGTLEMCLAILDSSKDGREVMLNYQTAYRPC
jgi:phthalate 4,5-cis-dihydrodiol dehydrogenase